MDPLEAATTLDWISPIVGLVRCAAGWRPISVYWGENPPAFYERVLQKRGIRTGKGGIVAGEGFVILVPKRDIARARRVLAAAGADLA